MALFKKLVDSSRKNGYIDFLFFRKRKINKGIFIPYAESKYIQHHFDVWYKEIRYEKRRKSQSY